MKEKIKEALATLVYMLYEKGILENHIQVHSIDETIDSLIGTDSSLVRFGDGEIALIGGGTSITQRENSEISQRLVQVLQSEKPLFLVAIADIFNGMEYMRKENRIFWKKHLLKFRKCYDRYCKADQVYYNAFMSRCYLPMNDRDACEHQFEKIKNIWKNKKIVVVEGEQTHNGVGNDLFSNASEINRILCPSQDAYSCYRKIFDKCLTFNKEYLFLLSLGATAKPLAYDLYEKGYRVIDIGNLDLEYEWYLMKAQKKTVLTKHSVLGVEANKKAGYNEYLGQISAVIQGDKEC